MTDDQIKWLNAGIAIAMVDMAQGDAKVARDALLGFSLTRDPSKVSADQRLDLERIAAQGVEVGDRLAALAKRLGR